MSQIASTYKARDVEETIDVYFYRPLGYWIARGCQALGITPNAVTIVSIFIGVAAGRLFYYRDTTANIWAIVLWVAADTLDSVDGQLARMTDHKSKLGRILDGLGGNIIFLSIYLHLFARMTETHDLAWPWFLALVLAAGFSHSVQSALADYYRNAYMKFVVDSRRSELEGADEVREEFRSVAFGSHPVKKILLAVYLDYTKKQERYSRNFQNLRRTVAERFGDDIPAWFADAYRVFNKPLMKYYAILTTNTRMIVLCAAALADYVPIYFLSEIVLFNLVMAYVTRRQEGYSALLLQQVTERGA